MALPLSSPRTRSTAAEFISETSAVVIILLFRGFLYFVVLAEGLSCDVSFSIVICEPDVVAKYEAILCYSCHDVIAETDEKSAAQCLTLTHSDIFYDQGNNVHGIKTALMLMSMWLGNGIDPKVRNFWNR